MAIELYWAWVALISLCLVGLTVLQFVHARKLQHRDDELDAILDAVPHNFLPLDRLNSAAAIYVPAFSKCS